MTEDEAKTRWCPFVRTPMKIRDNFYVANQVTIDGETDGPKCIASACMAWRWGTSPADVKNYDELYPRGPKIFESGYCGLAGKP